MIELLAAGGYLLITEGTYPVVGLGPRAREAAEEGFSLSMKRVLRKPERTRSAAGGSHVFGSSGAPANDADPELFERLRTLRKRGGRLRLFPFERCGAPFEQGSAAF